MKYTKSILAFLFLNLVLVFLVIFIANKTREIEKKNNNLIMHISEIKENIKINKIELITHQNSSYLKKLYFLYYTVPKNKIPRIYSFNQLLKKEDKVRLINTNK